MDIKVLVPLESNKRYKLIWATDILDYADRILRPKTDYGAILDNKIHQWMKEHEISYSLGYIHGKQDDYMKYDFNVFIIFKNKKDAMLFKLTWC